MDEIKEFLENGYDRLVIPKMMSVAPIEMAKLVKLDEEGNEVGHYSVDDLHARFGSLFVPTPIVDERFIQIRWCFDKDGTEAMFSEYLKAKGLADMREGGLSVDAIDFDNLPDNAFGIFSMREIKRVPKIMVSDENAI